MLAAVKKLILFLNLVLNYGINPSTILRNNKPLSGISNNNGRKNGIKNSKQ